LTGNTCPEATKRRLTPLTVAPPFVVTFTEASTDAPLFTLVGERCLLVNFTCGVAAVAAVLKGPTRARRVRLLR
jgi:hypothetical protein